MRTPEESLFYGYDEKPAHTWVKGHVRERHGSDDGFTGNSWMHPKVSEYAAAVEYLRAMGALDPLPEDPKALERARLLAIVKQTDFASLPTERLEQLTELLP